ncbi:hypothetical protein HON86_01245 [Candidatus Woesearchaeota archaeon]|nr:hypothetical protein [Candidatus Woesearchaeota archaeon]MBT4835226.1 hypothetical protein [Candidatus Woesearchaeota archaeon]MBT6734899.1 hypothetical protein [Candidatus Woesearchaeota archaeon]MBT7169586.1 hypothetical protein [Candidatus Woesearchaeota archaeon]MBT7474544.1 hypothetical protein [Candidatus Woesearchaeota archaeon]
MDPVSYYSKNEIKREISFNSQRREVSVMIGLGRFGKRPDIIQFENDITELVKKGATSFHISEEHWSNPLELKPGMKKRDLDNLRIGWDFVLDIDSPDLEDSKKITHYLIEAMKFHDVKNMAVKFSGNKGFHIAIPFKTFPSKVNDMEIINLFPEGPKIIAEYLTEMITPALIEKYGEQMRDKIEIDTVLISNRHMFRAPYSLHEKSGLASIPIEPSEVLNFNKERAKPENVTANMRFLEESTFIEGEATSLITQALDWSSRNSIKKESTEKLTEKRKAEYKEITEAIPEEYFAPCIKKGLSGLQDGKKRFLFILINFLKCVGWNPEEIEKRVKEWNNNQEDSLKEGYIIAQLNWHKANSKKVPPPNYENKAYYADIGILPDENVVKKFKNPLNYTVTMFKFKKPKKKKKKKLDSKPL